MFTKSCPTPGSTYLDPLKIATQNLRLNYPANLPIIHCSLDCQPDKAGKNELGNK